jgi:hypothetical protein
MNDTIHLGYCDLSVKEEGILYILFKEDTDIDEAVAVELLGNLLKLAGGKPHALVYDFNKKNIIIREISRKMSGVRDTRTSNLVCRAFIASSLQNKLESKHYIQSGKPSAETHYFSKKEDALKWAREKLSEYKNKLEAKDKSLKL